MAVYVDSLMNWGWRLRGSVQMSCHLIADSQSELIKFAVKKLGMKYHWYQPHSTPHFDLTASRRELALMYGAKELNRKEFVKKLKEIQEKVKNGEWQ